MSSSTSSTAAIRRDHLHRRWQMLLSLRTHSLPVAEALKLLALFTRVRGETVWKIAEGFLAVRFWRQEAADLVLFASVGGLRSPELGLIPIFQTVSPRTPVNKGKKRAEVTRPRP